MKNTSRKPYIYKVTNFENGQYYIGSQCSGKTVGVNYFTSSTNKEFKEDFKAYGEEKYKIEIIKEFEDPEECVRAENYIIRNYMLKKDGLCLNRFYCCNGKKVFSRVGIQLSEEAKQKLSIAKKGIPLPGETRQKISIAKKGTHHSEETKQKISITKKGSHHSEETRKKIGIAQKGHPSPKKGIPLSEEVRQKMSIVQKGHPGWNKGMHHSEEVRQKLSIASPNRIKISIEDNTFDSLTAASKYYNVGVATISYWVKTKKHNAVCIEK